MGMTVAFTITAVLVAVSWPFLARSRIMLSLVSTWGVTPGFHSVSYTHLTLPTN